MQPPLFRYTEVKLEAKAAARVLSQRLTFGSHGVNGGLNIGGADTHPRHDKKM